MLLNNAIQILSNARLAIGDLGVEIAENVQNGLDYTDEQKDLYRRIVLSYAVLKVLDPILVINEDDEVEYILGDYSDEKINRMLLWLRDMSRSGNRPVLSKILNPITTEIGGSTPGQAGTAGQNAFLYIGYAEDASGTGYSVAPSSTRGYIAFKQSTTVIIPTAATFAGLWQKYKGDTGDDGDTGSAGQSQYLFQAWADDSSGTGFTLTFNASKKYTAFLVKSNNTPPVQADFTGLWAKYVGDNGTNGTNGTNGASAFTYIAYADAADGTGFTLTFNSSKNYIAIKSTTSPLSPPVQADFAGLWFNYKGSTGGNGTDGSDGSDGEDAFLYIAYADDTEGSGFTTSFDPDKEYIAFLQSNTLISSPEVGDFAGLWRRYKGDGDRYATFSTTSLTIGTGTKFLSVEKGLAYTTGQRAVIALPNNPANRMEGLVTFYDEGDGQMEIEVDVIYGSGTYATWDVNLTGAPTTLAGQNAYYATIATDQGSGGTPQALSTTPAKVTQFDTVVAQSAGITASVANDNITINNNGAYTSDFNARVSGPTSATITFQLYKNNVAVDNMIDTVTFGASTSQELVSFHGVIENAQQSDVFDVRATASVGTPNLLVEQGRFNLYTIGFLNSEQFKDFSNLDVDTGTETVDNFPSSSGNAVKFEVVIIKGTNFKQSTILAVWDGVNQPEQGELGPGVIIGTVDVTLAVDFSGGEIRLRATATSDDWIVKGKRTIVG